MRVRFVCGFLSLAPECDVEHRLIGARAQAYMRYATSHVQFIAYPWFMSLVST